MAQQSERTPHAISGTWLVLVVAVLGGAWWWWRVGRPAPVPDATSARIACVSYEPYRRPGESPLNPKSFLTPQRIDEDLSFLSKHYDCIRTYAQSQGLDAVPEIAARHGMKVLMGIWIGVRADENERELRLGIAAAQKNPDALRGIIVGNEVLLRNEQSPQGLITYIERVRVAVPDIPVTTADVWEDWLRYPQVARSVDFITVHVLPYWENDPVPIERAISHMTDVYARMKKAFPEKPILIGETGWPSQGRPRGRSRPSLVNEARYVRAFISYADAEHIRYNVVEAYDQPWKRQQEGTVGGYWGIYNVDGQPKFSMHGPVVEEPHWMYGWLAGVASSLLFLLVGIWRWRGRSGWAALATTGLVSGMALAWQCRQMHYACTSMWEWAISSFACFAALCTALCVGRELADRLSGRIDPIALDARLRFFWLFMLGFYDLLLVFNGRYRDFPLGAFGVPCVGFALIGWLQKEPRPPMLEELFLSLWLPVLAAICVLQDSGLNPTSWLWLLINVSVSFPVILARWHVRSISGPNSVIS